jgi:hypothetical protein
MNIFCTDYEKNRKHLTTILNAHKMNGYGVEIGVKHGLFSQHLLSDWKCEKLYLVDPWEKQDGSVYDETHHDHDTDLSVCIDNLKPFVGKYEMIKDYSYNAYSRFPDEYFDFVYIDGNHSYDAVKDDLIKWYPKLKKGGLIAGDDYSKFSEEKLFNYSFGVKRAVDEFAFEQKKNVSIDLTGEWYYSTVVNGLDVLYFSRNWYFFK